MTITIYLKQNPKSKHSNETTQILVVKKDLEVTFPVFSTEVIVILAVQEGSRFTIKSRVLSKFF